MERGEIVPSENAGERTSSTAPRSPTLSARSEVPIRPDDGPCAKPRSPEQIAPGVWQLEDEHLPASNPTDGSDDGEEAQRAPAAGRRVATRSVAGTCALDELAGVKRGGAVDSDGVGRGGVVDRDDVDLGFEHKEAFGGTSALDRVGRGDAVDSLRPPGLGARPRPERADVDADGDAFDRVPDAPSSGFDAYDEPSDASYFRDLLAREKGRSGDLERQTRERYVVALDRLSKRLLDKRLDELTPDDVEQWMLASREKGFAAGTVNSRRNVLVTVLNAAKREHGLTRNVAHEVRPLRETRDLEDRNAATPEELRALLAWLRSHERMLYVVALTQALTGLRWGEVSALRWEALDAEARVLHVRRKVVRGEELPTAKTNRARLVGVPRALLDELFAYRAWVEAEALPGRECGLMFFSSVGTPLGSSRISQVLREARAAVGMRARLTSHGLRRTVTDLLRQAGVDPVVAKSLVGHTTDRMREHYSYVRPSEVRDAADRVAGLVFGEAD
ncbi:MAG: tyrosine-type recombinase/integrase [Polyangiales bacterium]